MWRPRSDKDCRLLSTLLFEIGTLGELGAHIFGETDWPAPGIYLSLLPQQWDDGHTAPCLSLKNCGSWRLNLPLHVYATSALSIVPISSPRKGAYRAEWLQTRDRSMGWVQSSSCQGEVWLGSHMAWKLRRHFHWLWVETSPLVFRTSLQNEFLIFLPV